MGRQPHVHGAEPLTGERNRLGAGNVARYTIPLRRRAQPRAWCAALACSRRWSAASAQACGNVCRALVDGFSSPPAGGAGGVLALAKPSNPW